MAQYKTGTVSVTNGSVVVTGINTIWVTNGQIGNLFTVGDDRVWYEVASIDSDTQLTLSAPYAGTTAAGQSYALTRDFTPNYSFPYPEYGDINTAALFKRAMSGVDAILKQLDDRITALEP